MNVEVWTATASSPGRVGDFARRTEAEGWDGMALVDSQNLAPDPYVLLGLAAAATSTLKLATGVTNPLTRHPAAAATAAATVQAGSHGRFVLGIGRGDSSLAHLGLAPVAPEELEQYLVRLQGYLAGEEVPFDRPSVDRLGMAAGPTSSRIRWIIMAGAKVPVDVAATGPKVIALAARHAERVTFAVGADPGRMSWAIKCARDSGRPVGLGAYVPVLVHPERDTARSLIRGGVASFARFSVMHGNVVGPASAGDRNVLEAVHAAYDMEHHFTHGSPQSSPLTSEIIDRFGVAGPPEYCLDRLLSLVELGLSKLVLMGGGIGLSPEIRHQSNNLLAEKVLPHLKVAV